MSGHNKWSKIKHKKALGDAQKSKIFSKHARAISLESKKVGGDVQSPTLAAVIERAKKDNMPADNIKRAVEKGAGGSAEEMYEVVYESYGPGGAALVIEGLTDNKNRTAAEIKHTLSKQGIELAAPGSALWAFEKKDGEWIAHTTTPVSEEEGEKLSALIDTLEEHDDVQSVYTNAE